MFKYIAAALLLGSIVWTVNPSASCAQPEIRRSNAEFPDTLNRKGLVWVAGSYTALYSGMSLYIYHIWYKDRENVPFHFYNDIAGYKQVDKFGHATTAYVESNLCYYSLRRVGVPRNRALLVGGLMGFLLQLPIEILDGLNEGWGFSVGDIAANTFGSALMVGQEYFFEDQVVLMKFSYWPSEYQKMANGYLGNTAMAGLSGDYNGHTYWFSGNINRITNQSVLPDWVNLALGYSAGGMFGEFENITEYNGVDIPPTQRYRQFFVSLDVDWTKIPTNSRFLKILFQGLNIVKIPFPALEYNTKGAFHGHWLYF